MLINTGPVMVLFRGTSSDQTDQGDSRIAFKSGKLVEYVKVMDPSTGDIWDMTLAESSNGEVQTQGVYNLKMSNVRRSSLGGRLPGASTLTPSSSTRSWTPKRPRSRR